MKIDYHIHSEFSDDSNIPMEEQIEKAISLGVHEMCFTDHVDYGIKNDWTDEEILWRGGDGIGIAASERVPLMNVNYPEYFYKLDRMKKIYGDRITIRNGLEFGIQQHTIPRYQKLLREYGNKLDFILLSIHQVDDQEFWTGDFLTGKTQEECHFRYYTELLNVIKQFQDYDALAHVDLISRYDPCGTIAYKKIEGILTDIFNRVIADGKGIELNTSSWHYKLSDTTPGREILKLYYSLGGRIITIGSDAHTPKYIADHEAEARQILKEIGFSEIYTFEKHVPISHKL